MEYKTTRRKAEINNLTKSSAMVINCSYSGTVKEFGDIYMQTSGVSAAGACVREMRAGDSDSTLSILIIDDGSRRRRQQQQQRRRRRQDGTGGWRCLLPRLIQRRHSCLRQPGNVMSMSASVQICVVR